jgi:hypothetical protein
LLFNDVDSSQQVQPQPLIKEASLVHRGATFRPLYILFPPEQPDFSI